MFNSASDSILKDFDHLLLSATVVLNLNRASTILECYLSRVEIPPILLFDRLNMQSSFCSLTSHYICAIVAKVS